VKAVALEEAPLTETLLSKSVSELSLNTWLAELETENFEVEGKPCNL
jgi:hypothetical protein